MTAFADYVGRYYHNQQPPPNVNGHFCVANGGLDEAGNGGTFECAIQDYTNVLPAYTTFDLSVGYSTMDVPANEYLRNIGVQIVIQNIMDKHGQYQYRISGGRRERVHLRHSKEPSGPNHFAHRHQTMVTRRANFIFRLMAAFGDHRPIASPT